MSRVSRGIAAVLIGVFVAGASVGGGSGSADAALKATMPIIRATRHIPFIVILLT